MDAWDNFLMAQVGISGVLIGLVFVGISINITKIVDISSLPSRALQAIYLLMTVFIVTSLLLVPGQSTSLIGMEVLVIGVVGWILFTLMDVRRWRTIGVEYRPTSLRVFALNQLAFISYVIAGLTLLFVGLSGLYWLVPAILISTIKAVVDAWVLLVEINR